LFVVGPHALPAHAAVLSGAQQVWFERQTPALGQVDEQVMVRPQRFITVVAQCPAHAAASSGVQQVPSGMQTSAPDAHDVSPPAPHAMVCPQLLVAVPHVFPAHVVDSGSGVHPQAPFVQVAPPSQVPQSTA
jgi:hypothetical protein